MKTYTIDEKQLEDIIRNLNEIPAKYAIPFLSFFKQLKPNEVKEPDLAVAKE